MAQYLSPQWFSQMEHAAEAHEFRGQEGNSRVVRLREMVTNTPFGDVSYLMTIGENELLILRHSDDDADVTFTQDYETAAALHRSELTTQEAFFAGRVRVQGHLNTLLENADLLQGVAPVFAEVRAATTY